jgi:CheY-like chemotaxis protein
MALDNARLYQSIQEGDRRKTEFLAMLAHELRNPLAPIRNAAQALRHVSLQDPTLLEARDVIDRQVRHMTRLIDDLLDMSRLSRGKILLRREPIDLVELVRNAVDDFRNLMEEAGQQVEAELPDSPAYVQGDPTRLTQVIGNVLNNAIKFSTAGGRISVRLRVEAVGDVAVIAIRDTGIGMEPGMIARAFETFSQADCSLDRSRGGLGLGLALVRGLVELHGGEVHAASEGLGKGTEVTIRLPLVRAPLAHRSARSTPPTAPRRYRVLVVEDNRDAAQTMGRLLTLSGHHAETALTGAVEIELARTFRPEVVLCDIGLPGGVDGYTVARALRQDPNLKSAYLIAVTGYGQEEDQRRCREAGFNAHVIKPVDYDELERLLAVLPEAASGTGPPRITDR